MKRLWFAAVFLLLCIGLCFAEQHYINKFYNEMSTKLDTAIVCAEPDKEAAVKSVKEYWGKNNNLIFTFTNHGVLDELSALIRSADSKSPNDDLRKARATLEVFYENQKITFANIF